MVDGVRGDLDVRHGAVDVGGDVAEAHVALHEVLKRRRHGDVFPLDDREEGLHARHQVERRAALEDVGQLLHRGGVLRELLVEKPLGVARHQVLEVADHVVGVARDNGREHHLHRLLFGGGETRAVAEVDERDTRGPRHQVAAVQVAVEESVAEERVIKPRPGHLENLVAAGVELGGLEDELAARQDARLGVRGLVDRLLHPVHFRFAAEGGEDVLCIPAGLLDGAVERDAVRLLEDHRGHRRLDAVEHLHGVDRLHALRPFVDRDADADVGRFEREVELLEDLAVLSVERRLHRGVVADDLVDDRLLALDGRVDVRAQQLDHALLADVGMRLRLDGAEEGLADGRRAEAPLHLDGEDVAVGASDEFEHLRLDRLLRNREKARLHVLQGELGVGVERAERQPLEHLLQQRPRALQKLGHLLRVGAARLRVADERGEHRALVHLRRAREVVAEHVQRELALARGLVDALLAVELGERLLPVALGVARPVRLEERRHLGLHGRDELRGGAVDLRLDRGERVARAVRKFVGVHELRDVELLDFREDFPHGPAHFFGNVAQQVVATLVEPLEDEVELRRVLDEELSHALAGTRVAGSPGVELPRVLVEEEVGDDVPHGLVVRRDRPPLLDGPRRGRGDLHAGVDLGGRRLREVVVHLDHRAGVVGRGRVLREVVRRERAVHRLHRDLAELFRRVGGEHHGKRAGLRGRGLGEDLARPDERHRAAPDVVHARQRALDHVRGEVARLGRDLVLDHPHEAVRVEHGAHREIAHLHAQAAARETRHLHVRAADLHVRRRHGPGHGGGEVARRVQKRRRLLR